MIGKAPHPLTPDQQIDRALQTLGSVSPTPDFKVDLLAKLQTRQATVATRPRWTTFALVPRWALGAVLLLLAAAGLFVAHRSRGPGSLSSSPLAADRRLTQPPSNPQGKLSMTAPQPATVNLLPAHAPPLPVFALGITNTPVRQPAAVDLLPLPSAQALDRQAVADLQAPSQPAPPLPTTEQERMVALMLRHREKHELAELNAERISRNSVQDQAAFSNFFDPPPPPESIARELYRPPGSPISAPPAVQPDSRGAETNSSTLQIQPSGDPK